MLQLADLGSVPVAFIFPRAFIAPFEEAAPLLCPSCGVPGSGGPPGPQGGGRESSERRCRIVCPRPRFFPFTLSSSLCFPNAAAKSCAQVSRELPCFLPSFSCLPLLPVNTVAGASATARLSLPSHGFPDGGGARAPGNLWPGLPTGGWNAWRWENGLERRWECGSVPPSSVVDNVPPHLLVDALRRHARLQPSRRQYKIITYH